MIRRLLVLAAAFAVAATLVVTAGATRATDPFAGVWVGQEAPPPTGGGSTDYMAIGRPGPNGARAWLYYETWATFCGGDALAAAGKGRSEGDLLTVTVTWVRCANGSPGAFPAPFEIAMTATGDGRIDWGGVIFVRAGAGTFVAGQMATRRSTHTQSAERSRAHGT